MNRRELLKLSALPVVAPLLPLVPDPKPVATPSLPDNLAWANFMYKTNGFACNNILVAIHQLLFDHPNEGWSNLYCRALDLALFGNSFWAPAAGVPEACQFHPTDIEITHDVYTASLVYQFTRTGNTYASSSFKHYRVPLQGLRSVRQVGWGWPMWLQDRYPKTTAGWESYSLAVLSGKYDDILLEAAAHAAPT
jgi:hypothetical protein